MFGHGEDRPDGSESGDNIRLKVWRIRRVPIFRVAKGRYYVDGKALEAWYEIARLSLESKVWTTTLAQSKALICRKLMSQGVAKDVNLTH